MAIFSSDALSSVAYATEEILFVLVAAGPLGARYSVGVAVAIAILLLIVVVSYSQIIRAYPSGGGAYIVARENLGKIPSLVAGASLLVDYVLTVAVSLTAGVFAITSAFPSLYEDRVFIAIAILSVLTLANLRGIRESGKIFALPAYAFIAGLSVLIVVGAFRVLTGSAGPIVAAPTLNQTFEPVTSLLLLRAFAAGCTALTGIEAISNGVQAFRKPETRNARITLAIMGGLLAFFVLGVTFLASALHATANPYETVISQITTTIFGRGIAYYFIQTATAVILLLAANTSFADFPRLASILAADRFLPVQLVNLGDRLVYSNGILTLAVISGAMIALFGGETHRLIPLYAVGVFIGFSISQFGMVRKWWTERPAGWLWRAALNLIGAIATTVVLIDITLAKFVHGAWAVLAVIPGMVALSYSINAHYRGFKTALSLQQEQELPVPDEHIAVIFISDIHKGAVAAARYCKSLHPTSIKAFHVAFDERDAADIKEKWKRWGLDIPLQISPSPYRKVTEVLLRFVRDIEHRHPAATITVVIPEFVCTHWWHELLHNHTAARIKRELLYERVSAVSVPIQVK